MNQLIYWPPSEALLSKPTILMLGKKKKKNVQDATSSSGKRGEESGGLIFTRECLGKLNKLDWLLVLIILLFYYYSELSVTSLRSFLRLFFFALPWRKRVFGPTVAKDLLFSGLIVLYFPFGLLYFFSFETMENGFKSHVSYFTLWQVLQASPYKWWLLKVRGIRKRQIACSPCLSFFFFFLIAGVLNLLPALLLLMRFFFRVRFTLKVRAVKSQSALPCDTHIFLLLLLLIVPPPHIFYFPPTVTAQKCGG